MAPRLIVRSMTRDARIFTLKEGSSTVGRTADSDIWLDDDSLSRAHARFEVRDGSVVLQDLGSTNGTFVDGVRIERTALGSSCEIAFGTVRCRCEVDAATNPLTFALHNARGDWKRGPHYEETPRWH